MTLAQLILDLDADFMRNAFSLVDTQRELVDKYMTEDFNRDGDSPLVDDSEYLHGIGFLTAQKHLTSSCRVLGIREREKKHKAFAVGPKINTDVCYAAVVNAVANHWKHADEWDFHDPNDAAKRTIETIKKAGGEVPEYGGYVASNVFGKIGLKRFSDLTPILKEWSAAVEAAFPQ
jgi:hypothetical protein